MADSLELKLLPLQLSSLNNCKTVGTKGKQRILPYNSPQPSIPKPPGVNPQIVSSVYGRLKTIILFFPSNGGYSIYPYFEFVKEFIGQLNGNGRRFLFVYESNALSEEACQDLKKLAHQKGNAFYLVPILYQSSDLAPWAQDCFLSISYEVNGQRQTYLVEPSNESSNRNVAQELVRNLEQSTVPNLNIKHSDSLVPFVGGNVLIGENFILIGLNRTDKEIIEAQGANWLGKNIILLESKSTHLHLFWPECRQTSDGYCNRYEASAAKQALFHLDLFITLAGKNATGQEVLVIGQPVIGFPLNDKMPKDVKELVKDVIMQTTKAIEETILSLRQELYALGTPFIIVRNPLPLTYYDELKNGQATRYWCWASYNNCLVEHYYNKNTLSNPIIKNIIMPSYGISSNYSHKACTQTGKPYGSWTDLHQYDLHNQWIWEDLGFSVTLMRQDYNPFIRRQGSLNCLTNCIERD